MTYSISIVRPVDILLPEDSQLPSASQVGVVEVLDEWISAPYPDQQQDRTLLLAGFSYNFV